MLNLLYNTMKKTILGLLFFLTIVSCEEDVITDVAKNKITPFGKIFVETNPGGYRVYVDNRNMGVVTPDSVTFLSEGPHTLVLKHDIFLETTVGVYVSKTNVGNVSLDIMKNPNFYANIYCSTMPSGAKIFLNDKPTNLVTPATISNVYPGQIKLKFIKKFCWDDSVFVKVKSNEKAQSFRILEDTSRAVNYRTTNSRINSDVLTKVVVDKQNHRWIGSIDHGLMKYDGKNWISYESNNEIYSSHITAIMLDSRNRLWVGTASTLTFFDGVSWQSFGAKIPIRVEFISSIKEDPTGNIWIGTSNGLLKYDNNQFLAFNNTNSGLLDNEITSIAFSKNGTLWVGTGTHGIISYENGLWKRRDGIYNWDLDKAIGNAVNDLIFDNNDNLWAFISGSPTDGKRSAFVKFDSKNSWWSEISFALHFPVEILSFYLDKENNIWMASKEALLKYNESKPIKFFNTKEYGFSVKHTTSAAFDQSGDLWVTTMGGGIIKIRKNSL